MDVRKFWYRLIPALALAVCIGYGTPVAAGVTGCVATLYYTYAGPPIYIVKTVPAATMCTLTMFNNADCFPGGNYPPVIGAMSTGTMIHLSATQVTMPMVLTNPSCGWVCNCGGSTVVVVTDSTNDGLPVELMDFAIEDGEAVGGGGESADRNEYHGDR